MTSNTNVLNSPAAAAGQSFWDRIAAELADAIRRGLYAPGQRLPSEHALAQQYGVNRHTIRRSLASLCNEGLLRVTQGSGTYVEDFAVDLLLSKRTRHRQNLALAGLKGGFTVVQARKTRATAAQAKALQVPRSSPLLFLALLGEAEGQVMQYSERHFPLPRFAELEAQVRSTGSISAGFAAHGVPDYTRKESRISAQMPESRVASLLRQPSTRPVLQVESLNLDLAGVPIELATAWFSGDRVKLTVNHDAP